VQYFLQRQRLELLQDLCGNDPAHLVREDLGQVGFDGLPISLPLPRRRIFDIFQYGSMSGTLRIRMTEDMWWQYGTFPKKDTRQEFVNKVRQLGLLRNA
jgi:hypothetical protein